MSTPIQSLNLPVRAENCLLAKGLKTVEELSFYFGEHGMVGLLEIPDLGRRLSHEVADRVNAWMVDALDKNDPEPRQLMASDATLLDYFAGKAMQAYITSQIDMTRDDVSLFAEENVAKISYQFADAMLRAREATS